MKTERAPESELLDALTEVLDEALRALGDAGRPNAANRLAGRAYVALRRDYPARAQRINGMMHRLARMTDTTEEQTMTTTDPAARRPPRGPRAPA